MYGDLVLPSWLLAHPRAWVVVPLMLQASLPGFVVLAHPRSKTRVNWEVSDLLKTAGYQVASSLAQRQAAEALVVARQFDSFNRMSAFVVHDLKNLVAQLSLMLSNVERHKHNPEFLDDMISTVESSVERMNRLLGQLRSRTAPETRNVEIDLAASLREVVQQKAGLKPQPELNITAEGLQVSADRERLQRVIGHIVQNAAEATPYDGKVKVLLAAEDGCAKIEVRDTGRGMDEQFIRERLFRPFDSTKGSGMGIGAHECREYIRELGGRLQVTSAPAKGALFEIFVPLAGKQAAAALSQQEIHP
jgi:putative PEP-CTERM system histidine kinase